VLLRLLHTTRKFRPSEAGSSDRQGKGNAGISSKRINPKFEFQLNLEARIKGSRHWSQMRPVLADGRDSIRIKK
jgi:hypothetical protein